MPMGLVGARQLGSFGRATWRARDRASFQGQCSWRCYVSGTTERWKGGEAEETPKSQDNTENEG